MAYYLTPQIMPLTNCNKWLRSDKGLGYSHLFAKELGSEYNQWNEDSLFIGRIPRFAKLWGMRS